MWCVPSVLFRLGTLAGPHLSACLPACVGAGRGLRGTSLLSRSGHASPALTGIRARARPVRLLASSGDTGSLAAPWTAEKAQDRPSPPASLHPSVLPTASRPGVARVPGASHSGGPSASCSNGAHAHAASSDQGPAVGGERRWGSVGRRWGSGGRRRPSVHGWFSGRILACHAGGPGSIPGPCRRSVPFWCPQPQSGAGFPSCHTQGTGPATARSPPYLPGPCPSHADAATPHTPGSQASRT